MKYSFEGLFKNEMTGLVISGDASKGIPPIPGDVAITQLGFGDDGLTILICGLVLLGMTLFLIFVAYISLQAIVNKQKKAVSIKKKEGVVVTVSE